MASYGVTFSLYYVFDALLLEHEYLCCISLISDFLSSHVIFKNLQEVLNIMKESESWRRREILCYKRKSSWWNTGMSWRCCWNVRLSLEIMVVWTLRFCPSGKMM